MSQSARAKNITMADSAYNYAWTITENRNMAAPRMTGPKWLLEESDEEIEQTLSAVSAAQSDVRVPIVGYEIMEQRPRFTVYKIHVQMGSRSWFVFRRYTDFIRLNERLQESNSGFNVNLPGRRWFKNNFDHEFIEERARALQYFINSVMGHEQLAAGDPVKQFFCLDDPPGPFDSLEQARAYCQSLESEVSDLGETIKILEAELSATKSQLKQSRVQQKSILATLHAERALNTLDEGEIELLLTAKRRHSCGSRLNRGKQKHMSDKHEIRTFDQVDANNRTVDQTTESGRDSGIACSTSDTKSDDETHGEPMLENVVEDNVHESYWDGSVEIVSHSSTQGVDQMKVGHRQNIDRVVRNDDAAEKHDFPENYDNDNETIEVNIQEDDGDDVERKKESGDSSGAFEMQSHANEEEYKDVFSLHIEEKVSEFTDHPADDSGIAFDQNMS